MKMMGLSMSNYWLVTYLFDLMMFALVSLLVVVVGVTFRLDFFDDPSIFIVLMCVWGPAQVGRLSEDEKRTMRLNSSNKRTTDRLRIFLEHFFASQSHSDGFLLVHVGHYQYFSFYRS
jgi:hypothetical protein